MFSQCCHLTSGTQPPEVAATSLCEPRVPVCPLASKAMRQAGEALSHRRLGLYICLADCYIYFTWCGWVINYRIPNLSSTYYV